MQPRNVLIKDSRMKVSLKNQQSFKWNRIAYLFVAKFLGANSH